MDNFWSKLLILGIVAAIGVFFVGNVYNPQKAAQEAMAESTQQSVNSVKAGVEDSAPTIVKGDVVISTVNQYCKSGNTVEIIANVNNETYNYTTSITSTSHSGTASINKVITEVVSLSEYYVKRVNKSGVSILNIEFTQQ